MCLLICLRNTDGSMVVAANRDEFYARPSRAPFVWDTKPAVLAGQDARAGGTWLAVNEAGVVGAVINRPTPGGPKSERPSRGCLPLLACANGSAAGARRALNEHLSSTRYNGFDLFVAGPAEAFVIRGPEPEFVWEAVPTGLHIGSNAGWDPSTDGRVRHARSLLEGLAKQPMDRVMERLGEVCRDHGQGRPENALCLHGGTGGTVSSTILQLSGGLKACLHAAGPPCQAPYLPVDATRLSR